MEFLSYLSRITVVLWMGKSIYGTRFMCMEWRFSGLANWCLYNFSLAREIFAFKFFDSIKCENYYQLPCVHILFTCMQQLIALTLTCSVSVYIEVYYIYMWEKCGREGGKETNIPRQANDLGVIFNVHFNCMKKWRTST